MDRNAQRAMVGIAFQRVNVGNLDHGEQSQQKKANHGCRHEGSRRPSVPVLSCTLCQQHDPLT
jgi:hypothetical protein